MSVHGSAEQPLRHHQTSTSECRKGPGQRQTGRQTDRQTNPSVNTRRSPWSYFILCLLPLPASQGCSEVARGRCTSSTSGAASGLAGVFAIHCTGAAREWICCELRRRIPNLMPLLIGVAELVPPRFGAIGKENK